MVTSIEQYKQKRNFDKTLEPQGLNTLAGTEPSERLSFVIQHHIARRDHFDFRLQWNGVLLSWAVPKGPSYNPSDKRLAIHVEDHPLGYKDFEGTIPKGQYGGGVVMLWDQGFWKPQYDVNQGLKDGTLKFELFGNRLKGNWALVKLKAKEGDNKDNWLLLKEKDDFAKSDDGISEHITSITTGRTMAQIEKGENKNFIKNPFNHTDAQLAKLEKTAPESKDWLYELKYDGYRILAYVEANNARLVTRNNKDYSQYFFEIASSLAEWAAGRAMVLDGEVAIVSPQGKTDFQALQNYMRDNKAKKLTYIVFDLLALNGEDLRQKRLIDRKEMLESIMKDAPSNLYYSKHVKGNGKQNFLAASRLDMEGIVGKKVNSIYSGTRNGDWIKIKCSKRQEFVVGGYTMSNKKTSGISSLLLGVYDGDALVFAGRAGTGFTEKNRLELKKQFQSLIQDKPAFLDAPKPTKNEKFFWLKPVTVAEVSFAEWTEEHLLRQASFKGLRTDKNPHDVIMERADIDNKQDKKTDEELTIKDLEKPINGTVNIGGIKISNPDKMIYEKPEIKKLDVVRYYAQVAERMMPYVGNRILSIIRCPKGITEPCFFKKHPIKKSKGVVNIPIANSNGKKEDYFYIENAIGIISEVQMGTLEFHVWGSRIDNLEKPDMMVFDLDPDEGMELEQVRQGVRDIKSVLDSLSLISYLKTSGGKGYHIVVPFVPSADWNAFHDFAKRVAQVMTEKWPNFYTDNIRKARRKGRIFIDWARNGRGATSIAPYSLRARTGATVSMPILWEELDTIAPNGIDMNNALLRIKQNDPWKDFYKTEQELRV